MDRQPSPILSVRRAPAIIPSIAVIASGLVWGGAAWLTPARADDGLAVGACVMIHGQPGRIVRLTPGGYVIQTQGQPADQAMNWARSDVTPGPCPAAAAPNPAQPPAANAPPLAPALPQPAAGDPNLPVGACVVIHGQPGRIVRLTPGGYVIQTQGQPADQAMNWARSDVTPGPCPNQAQPPAANAPPPNPAQPPAANAPPPGAVACPVANAANLGGGAQGQTIAAAIQAILNHPAPAGMDGAESATILSLQVGGPRPWSVADSPNFSADPNQPVYDVQATLKLCTDYRAAIDLRQEVSNFECFTSPAGQFVCQMSGSVNGMPGPVQRINK
jgi:hypothetical protein